MKRLLQNNGFWMGADLYSRMLEDWGAVKSSGSGAPGLGFFGGRRSAASAMQ